MSVDGQAAAGDVYEALGGILFVLGVNAVLAGYNDQTAVRHGHAVLSGESVPGRIDNKGAAGDGQLILGNDAVSGGTVDRQASGSVQCQIRFGIDHRVNLIVIDLCECPAVGQRVLRARRQRQEDLVRLQAVDGGRGSAGDIRTAQNDLHLVRAVCINDDLPVVQRAGKDIDALMKQGDPAAVDPYGIRRADSRAAVKLNQDRIGCFDLLLHIPVAEQPLRADHLNRGNGTGCFRRGGRHAGQSAAAIGEQDRTEHHRRNGLLHVPVHGVFHGLSLLLTNCLCWYPDRTQRFPGYRSGSAARR